MNIGKRLALRLIRKLYNTKIIVVKRNINAYTGGWSFNDIIYVNSNLTTTQFIQTIFHELGHSFCFKNNIYVKYHNYRYFKSKNKKREIKVIALKAERWVDRWAEREYKKHYPNKYWHKAYINKHQIKHLYNNL